MSAAKKKTATGKRTTTAAAKATAKTAAAKTTAAKATERAAAAKRAARGATGRPPKGPRATSPAKATAKTAAAKPDARAAEAPDHREVLAQIRDLEAQLDRMIDEASRRELPAAPSTAHVGDDDDGSPSSAPPKIEPKIEPDVEPGAERDADESFEEHVELPPEAAPAPPTAPTARSVPPPVASTATFFETTREPEKAVFDTAREMLSSDFYLKKWGRLAVRGRSEEVDDFGFDPVYDDRMRGLLEFLYTRYFRVEASGIENVPARGRCLLVANHSGTLPLDGLMIKMAVKLEHPSPRDVRWLTEDFIHHFPFVGSIVNRLGAVRACQENAERLLAKEQLVAVFPEGLKGTGKLFAERYRLQRFGRGGFIKLCLRTGTPIVPVAVVGAEETNPLLFRVEYLSRLLGLPYLPVTPTFPALGPLGLLPAPTKWRIELGEPIDFAGHGRDAADDEILVGRLAERVRATIQGMLDRAIAARKSVFFG